MQAEIQWPQKVHIWRSVHFGPAGNQSLLVLCVLCHFMLLPLLLLISMVTVSSLSLRWIIMTEPGESQKSIPEAAAHSTSKQVKNKTQASKQFLKQECEMWQYFLSPQGGGVGASQSQAQMSLGEDSMSHLSSSSRTARSPARNPLSFRTMQTKVTLLDGSLFTYTVEVRMLGTGETAGYRLKQVEKAGDRWREVRQIETSRDSLRPLKIGGDRGDTTTKTARPQRETSTIVNEMYPHSTVMVLCLLCRNVHVVFSNSCLTVVQKHAHADVLRQTYCLTSCCCL